MYTDMNMIRAGVADHPSRWPHSGCQEIMAPPDRYRLIDRNKLLGVLRIKDGDTLCDAYGSWVSEALRARGEERDGTRTAPIAVGSEPLVEQIKTKLGGKAIGGNTEASEREDIHSPRAATVAYDVDFVHEMDSLSATNTLPWQVYDANSNT